MPDLFLEIDGDDGGLKMTPATQLSEDEALALLASAEITASKLIPWGSNYSFAVVLEAPNGHQQLAIYKPRSGETPLYDFPDGTLYRREVAAYLLSRRLGWDIVPPTIVRDGPHGVGSLQLYVEPKADNGDDRRFWGGCTPAIERLVLFDHIANNADRKIGHCLRDKDGRVWGIDHGLTFNRYPKLRTVLWQYVGDPIAADLLADLTRLRLHPAEVRRELAPFLSRDELDALFDRVDHLLKTRTYPHLNSRRNVPYGWW